MHILKFSVLLKFKIINIPRKNIINNNDKNNNNNNNNSNNNNNNNSNNNNNNNDLEVVHPQSGLLLLLNYTYVLHVC